MLAHERYDIIMKVLEKNKIIKVAEIMEKFNISVETVRRDLEYLEKQGLLKRIYGGAIYAKESDIEPEYPIRKKTNIDEKKSIGIKAAELIEDNDTIILDIGTTPLQVAKNIKHKKNITVLTNSLLIINELANSDVKIHVLGGTLRINELSMSGPITLYALEQFHVDKAIIGAGGITINQGISDYIVEEAVVRKKIIERAEKIIVVADYSKFGVNSFASVCPIKSVDVIVTDWNVSNKLIKEYKDKGIEIIRAEKPELMDN
ncbi:MAG: DeoR/GlpR family DNA-binding transcription regulator [Caulobacteraceae bacterium]